MEMRSVGLFVLAAICLGTALLIPPLQSYLLSAMAISPLLLLAVGQVFLPRSKRSIRVWFNPIVIELGDEQVPLEPGFPLGSLSGRELVYSYFKQWHDFEIVTHRFWLLAGIGLLSLGAVWFSWQAQGSLFAGASFFYLATSIWALIVAMAMRWLWERRMLRLEGISMAPFSVAAEGIYQQIRYHFVDLENEYRGGWFESLICSRADDLTIIFYDEDNPDRSVPASGLMFHKLVWKESPSSEVPALKAPE